MHLSCLYAHNYFIISLFLAHFTRKKYQNSISNVFLNYNSNNFLKTMPEGVRKIDVLSVLKKFLNTKVKT